MGFFAALKKTMSNFYGGKSCPPTTYDTLVARVAKLEDLNSALTDLKTNEVTFGEILTKIEKLCQVQNQQTGILSDIQSRLNALETGGSPDLITVTELTTVTTTPTIASSECIGTTLADTYTNGSIIYTENSATCATPQDGVPCEGQLCINMVAGNSYYFRNTGGITLDTFLTPGTATYDIFKGSATESDLDSFSGDPRMPDSQDGSQSLVRYYPQEANALLGLPENWVAVADATTDVGSTVIGEWFLFRASVSGQFCVPDGVAYYSGIETFPDQDDPTTFADLPWNQEQETSPPETTCT